MGFLQPRRRSFVLPLGRAEDPNQGSMQHCRDCTLGRPHSSRPGFQPLLRKSAGIWKVRNFRAAPVANLFFGRVREPGTLETFEPTRPFIPSSEGCGSQESSKPLDRPGRQPLLRRSAVVRKVRCRGKLRRPCLIDWSIPKRIWIGGDGFGCFHRKGIPAGMIELEQGSGDL